MLASGIGFLDSTIVNVALPRIGQELPVRLFGVLEGQTYVYSGYLLTLSALLILAGALSDFFGRRKMLGLGLAGFGLTSVLCGLAPTLEALVLFRLLQGACAALLVPGSLSLINATFPPEERRRPFRVWAGASAATTLLGPFVGGLLVDTVSWRLTFLINVPLVAFSLYAVWRHVEESRDEQATGRFDWIGAGFVALAVGGLAFGAMYGEQRSWQDPVAFVWIGAGVAALAVLPQWMRRSRHPLIPLDLFHSRNFSVVSCSTLLIYGALYVTFYYLTLFLQGTLGYTAAASGLANIPGTLFLVLFSSRFGTLASLVGPRWFLTLGPLLMALGVLWWTRMPVDSQPWMLLPNDPASFLPPTSYLVDVLPGAVVFGIGLMLMVAPLTATVMAAVPVSHSGVASAINNAISRIGPQLVGAVVFIAVTSAFSQSLGSSGLGSEADWPSVREQISPLNRPPEGLPPGVVDAVRRASTHAFHLVSYLGAALLLVAAAVNVVGIQSSTVKPGTTRTLTASAHTG